jgi:hypothetical protein
MILRLGRFGWWVGVKRGMPQSSERRLGLDIVEKWKGKKGNVSIFQ